MEEQLINHLYNIAASEGFTGSKENFMQLINTDDEVVNYLHSKAGKEGYKGDIIKFTNLVRGPRPPLDKNAQPTNETQVAQTSPETKSTITETVTAPASSATAPTMNATAPAMNATAPVSETVTKTEVAAPVNSMDKLAEEFPEESSKNNNTSSASNSSTSQDVKPNPILDEISNISLVVKEMAQSKKVTPSDISALEKVINVVKKDSMSSAISEVTPEVKATLDGLDENINEIYKFKKLNPSVKSKLDNILNIVKEAKNKQNTTSNFSKQDRTKRANSLSIVKNADGVPDFKLTMTESLNQAFPEGSKIDAATAKEKMQEIINQTFESKLFPIKEDTEIKASDLKQF